MIITLINLIYYAFVILILARVVISWINLDYYHPVRRTVMNLTEPILEPLRRIIPPVGGLDFTPFLLLILAGLLRTALIQLIV